MSSIIFDDVSKRFGDSTALDEISLTFPSRQTSAVVGPSGSGKSTLIQMINGLMRPDSGAVHVFDNEIDYSRLIALRRRIGYALQGIGLFPHLTVRQNICLQAQLEKWPSGRIHERLMQLTSMVNLSAEHLPKYPHELSGGEQQRVGLCRAIMIDPPVLLLDEAFGALDPITRNEIHEEFLALQKLHAKTIVLVTHDLREALKLADQIFILNNGGLQQSGSRHEVMSNPENSFVQSFVHDQLQDDPASKSAAANQSSRPTDN